MRMHHTAMACCVLIGALATSAEAEAAKRDQSHAGRPGRDAARKASTAPQHAAPPHRMKATVHRLQPAARQAASRTQPAAGKPRGTAAQGRTLVRSQGRRPAFASSARFQLASTGGTGGISCVPYARAVTGMQVTGNGGDWWGNAAGLYDRGHRPELGSVMAFRATGGMWRGHVAVVRHVIGPREVLIDHANWGGPGIRRGSVMQNIAVIDVSPHNDWSEVRVQSGHNPGAFGRTYPVYGFIYNRPDDGVHTGTAYAGLTLRRSVRLEQVAEDNSAPRSFALQGYAPLGTAQAARRH